MNCPNCQNKTRLIKEYEKRIKHLRRYISAMISAAGLPDEKEACRTVIDWGKDALKERIEQ